MISMSTIYVRLGVGAAGSKLRLGRLRQLREDVLQPRLLAVAAQYAAAVLPDSAVSPAGAGAGAHHGSGASRHGAVPHADSAAVRAVLRRDWHGLGVHVSSNGRRAEFLPLDSGRG